jgi:transcriptional regulator with GAF, ATPase, and Fis domain
MHNLARYRFVQRLGSGAAGGVYLVEDRVLGGPPLALKRLGQAGDSETRASFAREFSVLASLSLAGVGRVFDLGVAAASAELPAGPFFTRDYVEGEPLDVWAGRRPLAEQVQLFARVLAVLGQLHRRAVLHGDLHPGNVIVDAGGQPHLIDFGLASHGSHVLQASGTPAYMAPELLRGGSASMSADLYAIGASFWAALTGQPPLAALGERMLGEKLRGQLPDLAGHEGAARAVLEALLWALAPDPRQRAPSADELCARLERALGQPLPVAPSTFVAPRPRGRAVLLDTLLQRARTAEPALLVLHGEHGIGKSTLLRELKWRLQLEGARVIELHCRDAALSTGAQLARQLAVHEPSSSPQAGPDGAPQGEERSAWTHRLAAALCQPEGQGYTLLVDDLDAESGVLLEVLRALPAASSGPPRVIASAQTLEASALSSFVELEAVPVSPLVEADVRALTEESLGPLEEGTIQQLVDQAAGHPGVLLEMLAWCSGQRELGALDLGKRAPGALGASLCEQRLRGVAPASRALLTLLAVARAAVPERLLAEVFDASYEAARTELLALRLLRAEVGALAINEPTVADYLRTDPEASGRELARRALAAPESQRVDVALQLELALCAHDVARAEATLELALAVLATRRARQTALRLCEACLALGLRMHQLLLHTSELYVELGDSARAAELAEELLTRAELDQATAARARLAAARAHVLGARLDRAVELLSHLADGAPPLLRAQAARELSRVHLRRGASDLARAAVADGLRATGEVEASQRRVAAADRAELLAIDATLDGQQGAHERAAQRFDEALSEARSAQASREEALVLGYRALSHERRGALAAARVDYAAGVQAARQAGDLGIAGTYALNLGNVSFRSGELEEVEASYTLASRLARRSGRVGTALIADNNLAGLHVHLGRFTRARVAAEATLAEAERSHNTHAQAKALHVLADVDARTGESEAAIARYDAAAARYGQLGRSHEVAEVWLDEAELLLDRGGVSDVSAGSAKVAAARDTIERHAHEDLRARLRLLLARARAAHGDLDGAVKDLAALERGLSVERDGEPLWQVLSAASALHGQLGASMMAARKAREAAELIEQLASRVPREAREAFLAEPRRRAVLTQASELANPASTAGESRAHGGGLDEPRFARLLELIKRLARERDLPRLLERITDAAVDLSGAERGFVLLVDAAGQLAPHTVRSSGGEQADPHVAFSRSIAEAVLIDGEPIVTVNARDDRRLNEFMSVHKLMLKSVACIPISGPLGVVGVLYLEHRLRAGRFQEDDIDLLVAFADQAAIALENARLWSENQTRSEELEAQANELSRAKSEIERLLEARTEELEQVRRDLGRARAELSGQHLRHGIVGQSACMRRVFALIERVADSTVPIVVEGESGTGKELVARAIHFSGARKKAPFVALNCAALPEHLLESELFGHVRGAFTGADRDKRGLFAQAEGGTIFLDEFADMPPRMQLDLLRVLQERCIRPVGADSDTPIDVRIIAASNRPLKQLVATGRLREDLYYRMSVVEIKLPALRERADDIPLLCDHLLARIATAAGGRARKLSRAALDRLLVSELPGNVRQLEHLLTSASMMAEGALIEPGDLGLDAPVLDDDLVQPTARALDDTAEPPHTDNPADLQGFKTRERRRILDALEQHGWNRAKAATALGMPRRTFYRRLSEFNIL